MYVYKKTIGVFQEILNKQCECDAAESPIGHNNDYSCTTA